MKRDNQRHLATLSALHLLWHSFTVNSDTQVTADVPTGAVTGKIVITTNGGSVKSSTNFTVN